MLEVSRRSPITGVISTMLLDITAPQLELWEGGEGYIQNVMPNLDYHERNENRYSEWRLVCNRRIVA